MSVIVAFGDSNTWGYDPATQTRFARDVRWTGVMRNELGAPHVVVEEGLNGRTTVFDDPMEPYRRGCDYLPPCLRSHRPLDLLILALGANDLKSRFSATASDIGEGMERLVEIAMAERVAPDGGSPKILIVAPPPLGRLTGFAEAFIGGAEKSRRLAGVYRDLAERQGVGFVDSGEFIRCSDIDGLHYEAGQHEILGRVLAEAVRMMLE
jgi:lysophospholipase L1-like esterase